VKAATEVTGIDIRLIRTPIVRVAGKISGIPQGAQNVYISIRPQGFGTQVRPDGTFEAWRMDPGKYTITANVNFQGQNYSSAPSPLEVGQSDVENLALQLLPPSDIQGQAEFEDEEARNPQQSPTSRPMAQGTAGQRPARPARRITLRNPDGSISTPAADLNEDGTFSFARVPAGKYRVVIFGGQIYVKSMRLGPTAMEGPVLDLTNGAGGAPLTLRLASAKGVIGGVVRDDKGPVGGARVVMAEAEAGERISPSTAVSKEDGSYVFNGVAPGKYKILALDEADLNLVSQLNTEDLEDIAEKVEVHDRETVNKDLKRK
jgi:hypothetical protein